MVSVLQIGQRTSGLSTTSGSVCGSLAEPLAIPIVQKSSRLLASPDPGCASLEGARYGLAIQIAQGLPRLLATSILNLLGGKQVIHVFL